MLCYYINILTYNISHPLSSLIHQYLCKAVSIVIFNSVKTDSLMEPIFHQSGWTENIQSRNETQGFLSVVSILLKTTMNGLQGYKLIFNCKTKQNKKLLNLPLQLNSSCVYGLLDRCQRSAGSISPICGL